MPATTLFSSTWPLRPWFFASGQSEQAPKPEGSPSPELVPDPGGQKPHLPGWVAGALLVGGIVIGLVIFQALQTAAPEQATVVTTTITTATAEKTQFTRSIRIGGTLGATGFAMIRTPRMRGGRDRGGGSSLTIQSLAEGGSIVQAGDVVAEFEARQTQDTLETYESMLAQTKATASTRKAEILIATETLRQDYRTTKAEAEKAAFDLQTAEVRSKIQAEIFDLLAEEGRASTKQLEEEVRLQEIANKAENRSLDITVEQDRKRLERTLSDFEKMKVRTPVGGLVVIDTMFSRGQFSQAAPGDEVYGGAFFMRVVDLSSMALYAQLNQADSQLVRLGDSVQVGLDAYPGAVFEGVIAEVGAMATASGGGGSGGRRGPPGSTGSRADWIKKVPVRIDINGNDDRIQPDLSASGDIILEQIEDALVVPRAAVASLGGTNTVWVHDGEGFVERQIEVGSISDTQVVVLAGLQEGDRLAAQPIVVGDAQYAQR